MRCPNENSDCWVLTALISETHPVKISRLVQNLVILSFLVNTGFGTWGIFSRIIGQLVSFGGALCDSNDLVGAWQGCLRLQRMVSATEGFKTTHLLWGMLLVTSVASAARYPWYWVMAVITWKNASHGNAQTRRRRF